ncbi:ATP-binding protein [Catenulispora subtropica]|uniref:CobQ/CobB/MinD/ParA nucleotide binding domain-containing protein n=1 Tax=Catenulispora subtropica TaxID=450798 RepID=A0ABN2QKH6_9ACTN
MRIALVGKGGSGKTTVSALLIRHLAAGGRPVVAVDADINQHLGAALGLSDAETAALTPMAARLREIKDHLRGDNPRIADAEAMVKTTPPGRGSRLLRLDEDNPVHSLCATRLAGDLESVRLMVTGGFDEQDLGVACYHSKVGAAELYLNHLVDGPDEYLVMDMTAGADAFASGLFTRFDLTCLVVEPTRKSVSVYQQYREYAREYDVTIRVVGNKVTGPEDVTYLREHTGADLVACLGASTYVRAQEQGRDKGFDSLEPTNRTALARLQLEVDSVSQDWAKFTRQAIHFHLKNAKAWGDRATGVDLGAQVDPDFVMGPEAFVAPS